MEPRRVEHAVPIGDMVPFQQLAREPDATRPGSCGDSCIDALRCRRDGVCWRKAKQRLNADLEQRRWTRTRIVDAIQDHVADHGRAPTMREWERGDPDGRRPVSSVVSEMFGSWNEAIVAAGEKPRPQGGQPLELVTTRSIWTKERIIAALQAWAVEHGRVPTSTDWARVAPDHPTAQTVSKVFGSWAEGVEQAGFERPTRGRRVSRGAAEIAAARPEHADEPEAEAEPEPVRQTPPIVWQVKVPDTGLRYRSPAEAYVAADEIEADGERVATNARRSGDDAKAEQAWDAAHELAEKIRRVARAVDGEPEVETVSTGGAEGEVTRPQPEGAIASPSPPDVETVSTDFRAAALGVVSALRTLLDVVEAELR
jgi:hypothetical protein